jgi:hypothetical protein
VFGEKQRLFVGRGFGSGSCVDWPNWPIVVSGCPATTLPVVGILLVGWDWQRPRLPLLGLSNFSVPKLAGLPSFAGPKTPFR